MQIFKTIFFYLQYIFGEKNYTKSKGSIDIIFSSDLFNPYCIDNTLTLYTNLNVSISINKLPPVPPMQELGLPVLYMYFFSNNQSVNGISISDEYNVNSNRVFSNIWSFRIEDKQSLIGSTVNLGYCETNSVLPLITSSFFCDMYVKGKGVPDLNIPPVSGMPNTINNLNAKNRQW